MSFDLCFATRVSLSFDVHSMKGKPTQTPDDQDIGFGLDRIRRRLSRRIGHVSIVGKGIFEKGKAIDPREGKI